MHTGSHVGAWVEKGSARITKNLGRAIDLAGNIKGVTILIDLGSTSNLLND